MTAMLGSLPSLDPPRSNGQVLRRERDPSKQKSSPRAPVDRVITTSDEWGTFMVPGTNQPRQQWGVGEKINIQFETGFASFILELWQLRLDNLGARGGQYITSRLAGPSDVEGSRKTTTVNWMVSMYNYNIEYPNFGRNFYLVVRNGTGPDDNSFLSVTFNILEQAAIVTSSGVSTTSAATQTSTGSHGTSTDSSAGVTTNPAAAGSKDSGNTNPAAAGSKDSGNTNATTIALGAILGVVGLAALLGLFFWLGKRRKQQQKQQQKPQQKTLETTERQSTAASPSAPTELYADAWKYPGELESPPVPDSEVFKPQPVAWFPRRE